MPTQNSKPVILLTGATGFLGSYLLKTFLENGHKVFVLARSKNNIDAEARILEALKFWDKTLLKKIGSLEIVEGDIAEKGLGISKKNRDLLSGKIDEIFHCAAITELNVPIKEITKVNVEGTRNVLEVALQWQRKGKLRKVNHISTAYVYGDYKERFDETDLFKRQKFYTTYEQTKFEAEKLVIEYRRKGLWIDIFRPPMIMGESKTGKTSQLRHIYQFMGLCKLELFESLPLIGACVSLVPVDITSKAIYLLDKKCTAKNVTYHPFPKKLTLIQDILNLGATMIGFKAPKVVEMKDFPLLNLTPVQRMLLKDSVMALNFMTKINSDKTNRILKNYRFSIPDVNEKTLTTMFQYYLNNKKE